MLEAIDKYSRRESARIKDGEKMKAKKAPLPLLDVQEQMGNRGRRKGSGGTGKWRSDVSPRLSAFELSRGEMIERRRRAGFDCSKEGAEGGNGGMA